MIQPERLKELQEIAVLLTPLAILIGGLAGWFGMAWLDRLAEKRFERREQAILDEIQRSRESC